MAVGFECGANCTDPPVHHVRRRHNIGTRSGMTERLFDQRVAGNVVQDITGLINDAVLSMGGVGVQGHIGDDAQLGDR